MLVCGVLWRAVLLGACVAPVLASIVVFDAVVFDTMALCGAGR
jgi:hypothetical protein